MEDVLKRISELEGTDATKPEVHVCVNRERCQAQFTVQHIESH